MRDLRPDATIHAIANGDEHAILHLCRQFLPACPKPPLSNKTPRAAEKALDRRPVNIHPFAAANINRAH